MPYYHSFKLLYYTLNVTSLLIKLNSKHLSYMSYLTFKPGKNQHALKSHGMSKLNHLGFKHAAAVKISNTKMTKHFNYIQQ